MRGRLYAWTVLGLHMAGQLVRAAVRPLRRRRGVARVLRQVAPEGYLPLAPMERDRYPAFMQCIACGLCSLACPALRQAPAAAWAEAWTFVAGASRMLDRATLAAGATEPCARCAACAAACPTGVPIPVLAALVERMAGESVGSASA